MKAITGDDIYSYIPHRFENIVVDKCFPVDEIQEDKVVGSHEISIQTKDALGRDIFLRQLRKGEFVLLNSFVAEILALSAIINAGGVTEDSIAFFAAITKFKLEGHLSSAENWTGKVKKVSDKGGFYRFHGDLSSSAAKGSCDIMAFYMKKADVINQEEPEKLELPNLPLNKKVTPFQFKHDSMMAVSECRGLNTNEYNCICSYTYPKDHVLVKGHFPDEPVMMGVMQWMMVEDAVLVWAKETAREGQFHVNCDAKIMSVDGKPVCDIQKIVCQVYHKVEDIFDQAELIETKKVAFRNRVKPGDELIICLSIND